MRPDDDELAALYDRFVLVRITSFKGVDMNRFRFDYDLTFVVLMMNAESVTYSRFGTRDGDSATSRLSIAGLKNAMRDVLEVHAHRHTDAGTAVSDKRLLIEDHPAFMRGKLAQEACYHCHFAHDARFDQLRASGKFSKSLLYQYPLPENIGITLDVDRNNVVQAVLPDSPAQRQGVRAGDVVVRAQATPVITAADLQFALDPVADPGEVTLLLRRNGQTLPPVDLVLAAGWRKTDISWRPSQGSIPPIIGIWEEPLTPEQKQQRGLAPDALGLEVSFLFPDDRWVPTRGDLRMRDVIYGVNGKTLSPMTPRQFHTYFRMQFEVGDAVVLNVLRGEQRLAIKVPCLDVKDE